MLEDTEGGKIWRVKVVGIAFPVAVSVVRGHWAIAPAFFSVATGCRMCVGWSFLRLIPLRHFVLTSRPIRFVHAT